MARLVEWRSTGRARIGRAAAAAVAVGVASASMVAVPMAGAQSGQAPALSLVQASGFGEVLSDGNTLYTLKPSSKPCNAACLTIWPAVTLPQGVKHATVGSGISASKLGSVKVHGVGTQLTYSGKRLYLYSGDTQPGDVTGNIKDKWGKFSPVVVSGSSSGSGSSGTHSGGSTAGSGGVSF